MNLNNSPFLLAVLSYQCRLTSLKSLIEAFLEFEAFLTLYVLSLSSL